MRFVLAFTAWVSTFASFAASGSEQVVAVHGEVPTLKRIIEVCGKAVHGNWGSDSGLPAILVQQQCSILWPSFLVFSTACQGWQSVEKCISNTFAQSFPLPVGVPKIMLPRCDGADGCFDIYEVDDPNGNGTRLLEECGYTLSGKAMMRSGTSYVAVADLQITPACLNGDGTLE